MELGKIRRIYTIVLSVLLILTALCLILACIGICMAGGQPFSRESVAAAFFRVRIPVYLCLAGILGSIPVKLLLPADGRDNAAEATAQKFHSSQSSLPGIGRNFPPTAKNISEPKRQIRLRLCVLCVALALLLLGILSGGAADVLTKAINICTECIGLG